METVVQEETIEAAPARVDIKKIEEVGFFLQESNFEPNETQERLVNRLSLRASDITDVYLLSYIDEPSSVDDPRTIGMKLQEEARYHESRQDYERSKLFYDVADYSRELAVRHILASTRAMLYEYKRWVSKDGDSEDLLESFQDLVDKAESGMQPGEILEGVDVGKTIIFLRDQFKTHNVNWSKVCEATIDLKHSVDESKDVFSHRDLLVKMTLLHQQMHAGGGGALELMLRPGQKDLGNELLLRFNSDDPRLTDVSMFDFGSKRAKILFQTDRRQRKPFAILNPERISEEEIQILLAKSLLGDPALSQRIDRASKSMRHYLLFSTVLFNVFGGDLNPQDELMDRAKNYLRSAVEVNSIDPSSILENYLKKDNSMDVLDVAQGPTFFASLKSKIQEEIIHKADSTLSSDDSEARIKALTFLEVSGVLDNENIDSKLRSRLVNQLKTAKPKAPEDTREYYFFVRLLEGK